MHGPPPTSTSGQPKILVDLWLGSLATSMNGRASCVVPEDTTLVLRPTDHACAADHGDEKLSTPTAVGHLRKALEKKVG